MLNSIQFALLQKEAVRPTADQVKRALRSFSTWTDADAVRLAADAQGILMRHLGQDQARALQSAFHAEGVATAIVAESNLPKVPEIKSLQRADVWPQGMTVYDSFGHTTLIAWEDVTVIAAAAAQHYELNRTQTDFVRHQYGAGAVRSGSDAAGHKFETESQLLMQIVLMGKAAGYQVDAARFVFKPVIDRPGLSTQEKFIWLVREICRNTPQALLNSGARHLTQGGQSVPAYANRQTLLDEIVWLLWQQH